MRSASSATRSPAKRCIERSVSPPRNSWNVIHHRLRIESWISYSGRVPIGDASDFGRVRGRLSPALGEAYEHDIFYLAYGHGAADHRRTRLADPSGLEALTLKRAAINSASSHIAVAKSARTSLGMLGASRRERSAVENRALRGPISTGFVPARCPYRQRLLNRPVYRPVFHSMTIGRRSIFLKQRLGRKG